MPFAALTVQKQCHSDGGRRGGDRYVGAMKVIGASNGLPTGQWAAGLRSIRHWRGKSIDVNSETVARVGFVGSGAGQYNYAAGGAGIFAGAALAGPLGALVGGLLPKGFKGTEVEFVIEFRDSAMLRAKGKPEEYDRLVKWSMEAPGSGVLNGALQGMAAERLKREAVRGLATDNDRERLRAELAAEKAAKKSPEARAEKKARIKAVRDQRLPFKETTRLIMEIEDEYR